MGCGHSNHGDQIFIDQTKDKGHEIKVPSTLENIDEQADEDGNFNNGNKNLITIHQSSNTVVTTKANIEHFNERVSDREQIENFQENKEIPGSKSKAFMGLPTKNTESISRSQADFFEMLEKKINSGPEVSDYELEPFK